MIEFFQKLFSSEGWPPRKICGDWSEDLIILHLVADAMIFLAYMAIPALLAYFIIKNKTKFSWIIWLFVCFIFGCGLTHLVNMLMFFDPMYRLDGLVKIFTGVISLVTVIALAWLVPRVIISPQIIDSFVIAARQYLWIYFLFGSSIAVLFTLSIMDIVFHIIRSENAVWNIFLRFFAIVVTFSMFVKLMEQYSELKSGIEAKDKLEEDLKKTNKELEQFAYIASHDLRAPLRAISNLSEWVIDDLKDKVLPEETKKHLRLIQDRIKRMNSLIEGILQYSRVGRLYVNKELVNLNKVVSDVLDSIDKKKFNFSIDALPTITANPTSISQLFQNLISNSIKHHTKDDGNITLLVLDRGNHYEFILKDDGPGISESFLPRLFGMFQTYRPPTSESTGIGLALCRKIVEEAGGKIWAETDKGAKFLFTWPK